MTQISLSGKTALITGASRGLGASIARAFATAGADVAICARNIDALNSVADDIHAIGRRAIVIPADLADPDCADQIVTQAESQLGHLDIVLNNAGISPIYKQALHVTRAEWEQVFAINVTAPFQISVAAARAMSKEDRGGTIIQMASVAGIIGSPRMVAYSASKAALIEITRTLALEWARKRIRVNAIAPGYIETDLTASMLAIPRYSEGIKAATPLGRIGKVDEIDGIAVYLASDAASYATGQVFIVDGGISAA
jgi:NAD(P)-dependent dehydrogenase (short-subunit alcohol dehydrogenase family)